MLSKFKNWFVEILTQTIVSKIETKIKASLVESLWETIEDKTFYSIDLYDIQGNSLTHLFLNHVPQIGSYVVYDKMGAGIKYRFQVLESEMTANHYRVSFKLKGNYCLYEKAVE